MDEKVKENIIARLIERMERAIPGDTRQELIERYAPVFRRMTEQELGSVWERISVYTDAQLYLIDERVYVHLAKRSKSPRIGSDVHLLFHTVVRY